MTESPNKQTTKWEDKKFYDATDKNWINTGLSSFWIRKTLYGWNVETSQFWITIIKTSEKNEGEETLSVLVF